MHATAPASPYRVYRNILLVLIRGVITALPGVVILLCAPLYATHTLPGADATSKITAAVAAGIAVLLLWIAVRVVGSRISAGPDGLYVYRVFRRRRYVPWEDATGFRLIRAPRFDNRFTRSAVAVAVLPDQRPPLYCLGASFTEPSKSADTMLSALQSEHQSWLSAAGEPATTGSRFPVAD
jgi:hypothetical protein